MLFRFALYGFLKNQRYFDPFLILVFREKGLSFTLIGLLIAFREICINLMEIPTGAIADVVGRRRSMIFSHLAYIAAFMIFGASSEVWMLFAAMFFFSIGEAFRSGTHKAIIFNWLSLEGRDDEKTKVYGYTRSWSKLGSALSVVIAAALVFTLHKYSYVFYFCIIPYLGNIINFLGYPPELDGPRKDHISIRQVFRVLLSAIRNSVRSGPLRRLFIESMGFGGCFTICKDYLQPVLSSAAVSLPMLLYLADRQRTAVLIGAVYLIQYLMDSYASRHAHVLADRAGCEQRVARWMWWMYGGGFAIIGAGVGMSFLGGSVIVSCALGVAAGGFVAISVIQNFWRPILIGRFAAHANCDEMATVLSIESQGKSLFAAGIAPVLGLAVDLMGKQTETAKFIPVAVVGLIVTAVMLLTSRPTTKGS